MRRALPMLLAISMLFPLTALAATAITAVGSTTVLPIVAEAAKAFRKAHPGIRLTVSGGGSGVGIASIRQGTANLGMASRELSEREAQALSGQVEVIPIGRDAVAAVVSKAVHEGGVTHLSLSQIAGIYRGEVRNWRDVGGPDARILVIDKEPSRGTRHVFAQVVLGSAHARAAGASVISGSNNEEQAIVAGSEQAIGMLSMAWLNDRVRALGIDTPAGTILPDRAHIADGSYPIQRALNVIIRHDAPESVRAFVAFLRTPAGQAIVRRVGYLPID